MNGILAVMVVRLRHRWDMGNGVPFARFQGYRRCCYLTVSAHMLAFNLVKTEYIWRKPRSGTTIPEVMVVLAIMALVIDLAAPRFTDSFGRPKSETAEVRMGNLKSSLQFFYTMSDAVRCLREAYMPDSEASIERNLYETIRS